MEWLLIALVILGLVVVMSNQNRKKLAAQQRQTAAVELGDVKQTADEDVTQFGEELQRLDSELAGKELDEGTRQDYQRALDDYDDAKLSLDAVTEADQIRHVAEILEDGRYAVACVQARVVGDELPARRPPCFFNPQHGPSVRDVTWTPDRGAPRDVPACALDAERVDRGAEPDSRKVMLGARRVPYWQAGPAYAPWTAGYFGASGIMPALFMGTMMGMVFSGGFDGSYEQGLADGQDSGDSGGDSSGDGGDSGGDYASGDGDGGGGGWDGGGGDFGGGDFGGGDFGGGDF
ncbi:MAG: hypothetical protein H0U61_11075 [Nocardioidaceae bacterium]|nr:hypothetical protein [Nocardioidaceae bacterium]